ncbi:hypothetical protein BDR06DRAFT_298612 [Suillus hirtellus]|nr:hypothetical protein BDR06DRAFT_298612 [Suillus hirtellus]
MLSTLEPSWARFSGTLAGTVCATCAFVRRSLQLLFAVLRKMLRSLAPCSSTKVRDSEAQPLDLDLDVLLEEKSILTLDLQDIPTSDLEAPSIKWLLETSTDLEVVLATAKLVPQVEWPLDLDISDMLHQLSDIFTSCVDVQGNIVPSLEEKASACTTALTHLYYGRVLQAHPDCGNFITRERGDVDVFWEIFRGGICTTDRTVLHTTINLCRSQNVPWAPFLSEDCPDSVLERLSHLLPYHFVTGRANTDIEDLAITVISKLLFSPSPPSTQIIANCTLLACVMVGTQIDKNDIVRIDKSPVLPQLSDFLLTQFQKALWAWDGGELDENSAEVVRRAWNLLSVICRILELAGYHDPSYHTMRNLEACRRIYSRIRSSEQNHASVSLVALRNALHFTFAAANVSRDSAELWYASPVWPGNSHSPEDFDWMVDYLNDIYSDDHEAAYDILLLLGTIRGSCSPAKQHLFIERLIACMDSNIPFHLRHAALRAAHSAREEIASIDVIDDARLREMVLTNLSPAIMSVVCLHPSPMPANDGSDRFFDYHRDLCYLEIIFALARNSIWHPHLSQDRHIDRCISMIPKYCNSEYYSQHAFYIAGILLQIAPEQSSDTSLYSVTEQQWWDVMRCAWYYLPYTIRRTHDLELLVFVERTKKYMQIASKSDLENLIGKVDDVLDSMEPETELNMQDLEEGGPVTIAVKKLRNTARNMLESLVNNY